MKYQLLGNTGIRVSQLSLGAMTFGEDWGMGVNFEESKLVFDSFFNAGGNFIDTSILYTKGTSEKYLGEMIQTERDYLVLSSKYTLNETTNINRTGMHRKNLIHSVDESLKSLKTDYIDLYYVHAWDFSVQPQELMKQLEYLVASGKVLSIGISDTPAWLVSKCNTLAELKGWSQFVAYQGEYSLAERSPEADIIPMCEFDNVLFQAWSPLAAGALTGKYNSTNNEIKRMAPNSPRLSSKNLSLAAKCLEIAKDIDQTASQVALRWVLQKQPKCNLLFGARTLKQCQENLKCLDFILDNKSMTELNTASQSVLGFPHEFLESPRLQELAFSMKTGTYFK